MRIEVHCESQLEEEFIKEIEEKLSVRIIKSQETLSIESDNYLNLLRAKKIFEALNLGFEKEICKKLLKEDYELEIIRVKDFLINRNNKDRLRELKGRVIGKGGSFKRNIQTITKTYVVIHKNVIGIIGDYENLYLAKKAIEMLLSGRKHSTVYEFLNESLKKRKLESL